MGRVKPYLLSTPDEGRVVAALGADIITLPVPQWADFEVNYVTGYLLVAEGVGLVSVRITDTGIQEEISNVPSMWWATVGVGQDPFVLPQPLRFHRNSSLRVEVADVTPAPGLESRYWLTFTGTLIYPD